MLNSQGAVAEATGDNIFIVRGNSLVTPAVNEGILEGITRNTVMTLARDMGAYRFRVSSEPIRPIHGG